MRCLTCSDGIPVPGTNHCPRCRPTIPAPRTPQQLADLHRAELLRQEATLIVAAARDRHYRSDLDRVRAELAALDRQAVTA